MKLRDSKAFKALAFVLMSLVFVSFVLRSVQKVVAGQGLETYLTGKGLVLNYWSALVISVAFLVAVSVAIGIRLWKRLKNARQA